MILPCQPSVARVPAHPNASPRSLNRLSPRTVQFVRDHIPSVHTLDVLLFLFRNQTRAVTCEEVLAHTQSSQAAAHECLTRLTALSLVEQTGLDGHVCYQYRPEPEQVREIVRELAHLYDERSTSVVRLIYAARS